MRGLRDWRPTIFEYSGEVGRDILEDERERRERRRRGFRKFLPGAWLSGRSGVVILLVFLVVGGVVAWWQRVDPTGAGTRAPVAREPHPEAGRRLTAAESGVGGRYGRPLFLGEGGLPVVRLDSTGEVRELTPVEVEYENFYPFRSAGWADVVWAPGPRGWGMWWRSGHLAGVQDEVRLFGLWDWRVRQEDELRYAVREVSLGLQLGLEGAGQPVLLGPVPGLSQVVAGMDVRYGQKVGGWWGTVPGLWVCGDGLESDLRQGLTEGCPGEDMDGLLSEAWADLGGVLRVLERLDRLGHRASRLSGEELFVSGSGSSASFLVADLVRRAGELEASLGVLEAGSLEVGVPVVVRMYE